MMDPEDRTNAKAGNLSIISEPKWFHVKRIHCAESKRKPAIIAHYYCEGNKFTAEIIFSEADQWLKDHLGDDLPFDLKNFFNGGFRTKMKIPKEIFVDEAGNSSKILKYKF